MKSTVKRVLVFRLGSLGDTVAALPCYHLIARTFPNAERRLLTNFPVMSKAAPAAAVLGDSGLIHGYIDYAVGLRSLGPLLALRARIREFRPDVLVYLADLRPSLSAILRDVLFFRFCGIPRLIGVPYRRDLRSVQISPKTGRYEFEAQRLANALSSLGDAHLEDRSTWDLRLTREEQATANSFLAPLRGRPLIAISLGAKRQPNQWEPQNWQPLLERMAQDFPAHALIVIGAEEERQSTDLVSASWSDRRVNLCGKLTPRQSGAALRQAQFFVCHDSGPMHLAAAVNTPCVAIFSARDLDGLWYPFGPGHQVLRHNVECSPCFLEVCIAQKKKCILSITVDEVLAAIHRTAANTEPRRLAL